MDMDSSAHITDPRKEVRKSWPRALEPTSIQAADLPSSSDYSLRRDWMREWALDLDQLAVLRDQLTTTQAELECTRCENTALNSAVDIMRADAEVYKETIVTQRLAVKTLQNRVQVDRETHQQLLQSYSNVLTELDQVKAELARQASAFVELQRQKDEVRDWSFSRRFCGVELR
ncbi:hypothetical protein K438DRAFT_626193 [Mycena galopus ATCC 62051]|nr:hypothetical protein K438DRAFT_626193 [Mycena galopus ATCC 62051]